VIRSANTSSTDAQPGVCRQFSRRLAMSRARPPAAGFHQPISARAPATTGSPLICRYPKPQGRRMSRLAVMGTLNCGNYNYLQLLSELRHNPPGRRFIDIFSLKFFYLSCIRLNTVMHSSVFTKFFLNIVGIYYSWSCFSLDRLTRRCPIPILTAVAVNNFYGIKGKYS